MMTAQKIDLMRKFYGFPEDDILFVFLGSEEGVSKFYQESESTQYPYIIYEDVKNLLEITNGVFPTVVLMNDGEIIHEYGFRDMKEVEVKAFFENTNEPL